MNMGSVRVLVYALLCANICLAYSKVTLGQQVADTAQFPSYFFQGTLFEATDEVVKMDGKFMIFLYDNTDTLLTPYFRDTVFTQPDVTSILKTNFVCLAADTASEKGQHLITQFRVSEFPAILFVDKRGQEFYSVFGRMELDQMFDICERALFD